MKSIFDLYPYSDFHELNMDYFIKVINAMQEQLDTFEGDVLDKAKAYTDEQLNARISTFENDLAEFENLVNANMELFETNINNRVDTLENETFPEFVTYVNKQIELMNSRISAFRAYIDNRMAEYDTYIKAYIASQLLDLKVINIFTGETVSVQEMLDYLATFHLTNALTYSELNALQITYQQFNDIATTNNLTNKEFNINSKSYYHE